MPVEWIRRRRPGARGGRVRALTEAIEATLAAEGAQGREVSLLLTDDREIHALNLEFRGKDKPTDVLAFPFEVEAGPLGDVIVSVETAARQARARRTTLDAELELLVVHGTLHLLGFDHATPAEKRDMSARTRRIRRGLARARG